MLAGCGDFGPARLGEDQIGYSRTLTESQKRQTLLNVVQLRYGEAPVFLNATQVISGYQLQRNATAGFELFPTFDAGTYLSGTGGIQFQQTPTFTFQPVTGQEFAQSYIRPLSPTELLPLSLSGLPIDVLFRLAVQSIGGLQNVSALDAPGRGGSSGFFELLVDLRRLQVAGLLDVRLDPAVRPVDPKESKVEGRLILALGESADPDIGAVAERTRRLLGFRPGEKEAEVVYGRRSSRPGQIAIVTRPILGVLGQLGAEAEVPPDDVRRGLTIANVGFAASMRRPAVIIHSNETKPASSFVEIEYRKTWYWIAEDDFDSKVAFTVVQLLLALSQTTPAPGTVVTIPAR